MRSEDDVRISPLHYWALVVFAAIGAGTVVSRAVEFLRTGH